MSGTHKYDTDNSSSRVSGRGGVVVHGEKTESFEITMTHIFVNREKNNGVIRMMWFVGECRGESVEVLW